MCKECWTAEWNVLECLSTIEAMGALYTKRFINYTINGCQKKTDVTSPPSQTTLHKKNSIPEKEYVAGSRLISAHRILITPHNLYKAGNTVRELRCREHYRHVRLDKPITLGSILPSTCPSQAQMLLQVSNNASQFAASHPKPSWRKTPTEL